MVHAFLSTKAFLIQQYSIIAFLETEFFFIENGNNNSNPVQRHFGHIHAFCVVMPKIDSANTKIKACFACLHFSEHEKLRHAGRAKAHKKTGRPHP